MALRLWTGLTIVATLAVTASSYSSGEHFTFYQSAVPMQPWVRS